MTVEYTRQREQFGRPIGSFQALKHRMADLLVRVQMHGGIAITWEHDALFVLKRAQALHQLFGLPHQQRASLL